MQNFNQISRKRKGHNLQNILDIVIILGYLDTCEKLKKRHNLHKMQCIYRERILHECLFDIVFVAIGLTIATMLTETTTTKTIYIVGFEQSVDIFFPYCKLIYSHPL